MSLKEALAKAGLKTTKSENERRQKALNKNEKFQETRIFCEVCETTQQDVERYTHKNALIDAEWICVNCADKNSIHDDFRQTRQSHASKNKSFKRFYGPTKDFNKEAKFEKKNPRFNKQNTRRTKEAPEKKKPRYTIDENGEKNFNC